MSTALWINFTGVLESRLQEKDQPLSERYAIDYAQMGAMGAYMTIREDMAQAFNAADVDNDGFVDQQQYARDPEDVSNAC